MSVRAAGVDGWRRGWVAVLLVDARFCRAQIGEGLAGLLEALGATDAVAVDMPIGLAERGERACDREARRLLGARASTVFPTSPRPVVMMDDYAQACAAARAMGGPAPSRQSFGLRARILEVDELASRHERLVESHPEVGFHRLAGRALPPKKSWAGQMERRRLLQRAGVRLPMDLGPAGVVPVDDVLDAAVLALTAHRVATGVAQPLPADVEQRDPRSGRRIAIWV
jgi:predicted RNase H-like nuclease